MTTQQLSKLGLFLAILAGFTASLSATQIKTATDGVGELPTFYVYAFESEAEFNAAAGIDSDWTYEKSLDLQSKSVEVEVLLPNEELVQVQTPAIETTLVES